MSNNFSNEPNRPFYAPLNDRKFRSEIYICSQLRSQLFYLWTFIAQQDLWEDAYDFLDEFYDPQTPVDFFLSDAPF